MRNKLTAAVVTIVLILSFTAAVQGQERVAEIVIEGNENISEETIRAEITTEPGDEYDREKLREDMERVYELGYFEDVNISFSTGAEGLVAFFRVHEFPVITEVDISGLEEIYSQEEILSVLNVEKDEVLNVERLNQGLQDLAFRFQDDGYVLARVEEVDFTPDGRFIVRGNPGYLNEIVLEGNEKTRDYVIMRELENLEQGEPINQRQIEQATQRLFRLEYFEELYPDLRMIDEQANKADLALEMEEADTGRLNFGAGYHSEDGWFGFVDAEETNLRGRGQNLGFEWRFGDETRYNLHFEEPRLYGTELGFGIEIYDEERIDTQVRGVETYFEHPLTDTWRGGLGLMYSRDIDERVSTRSVTNYVQRDTRNHPIDPDSGTMNRFSIETAGYVLGGDDDYFKARADNRTYHEGFADDHSIALRGEVGISNTDVPLHEEFIIGGPDTLRGYSRKRGDNMALFNAEYRFGITDTVQGAAFYDYGDVWDDDESTPHFFDLQRGTGLGVRLATPIGHIRLDYGFDDDWSGTPHIGFGQAF
ncbi:BamA/OMP85 family outer membrane protein [Halarsenatibacter silvermanii]|uniref:Beta-barrel assembly machine subunit BamA n=1 Tax=Halarsenatibacter silvermanii TaxID=321763 RepID=A0A1G9HU09_9FIRM|nr:BamA/TamA family outer membrane protein [Halarsenatibacter silvermanii]SDL16439.1 Beta-barrel assembly machine subunit BamA [Halarsenatibacter silvermanii]